MGSNKGRSGPSRATGRKAQAKRAGGDSGGAGFPTALAELLRSRRIRVPNGLLDAPPEAYARQDAAFVQELAKLDDDALRAHAERVAGYARRQAERARRSWDTSPLIVELRRRKLKEPPRPQRVVGAAFNLKKPLPEWSDAEVLEAARQWSEQGAGR